MACRTIEGEAAMTDAFRKNDALMPIVAHRINERRVLAVAAFRISKHCRAFLARIAAALDETRRREAARIIHQYRHLMNNDKCNH